MGYLRDQQGIMNRYLRESSNWKEHLERTRAFISSSFKTAFPEDNPGESVAVLGSGWLLDVPLEKLLRRFSQVYLVDIYHPPQIRKKVENMKGVMLVETDLSGGAIEQVWKFTGKKGTRALEDLLESICLKPPLGELSPDAIISVNLLNQLDILICDHLLKKGHNNHDLLDRIRTLIQSFHLQWTTATPGCLITDTKEISTDRQNNESAKSLLFTRIPEGRRREQWTWVFDNSGSYRPGIRSRMEVEAVEWS